MRAGATATLAVLAAGACAGREAGPPPLVVYRGADERPARPAGLQRLTSHPADVSSPAWSADGRRLFYLVSEGLRDRALWLLDRQTGERRRLLSGDLADPAPTPDGHAVLLARDGDLWRFELQGRRLVQLLATPWEESGPVPHGDNGALVFSRQSPEGGTARDLWTANARGDASRRLTNGFDHAPAVGPAGRLAFVRRQEIWVLEEQQARALTNRFSDGTAGSPTWSPDGTRLAFSLSKAGRTGLWAAEARSGERRLLLGDLRGDPQPAWSPTGDELAFVCDAGRHRQVCRLPVGDAAVAAAPPPRRVLVVPLEPLSARARRSDLGRELGRKVGDALVATGRVRLVERGGIEALLKEHEFTLTDLVDAKRRATLGRMAGADVIVMGTIDYGAWTVAVHLRAVDVSTAEVLWSDTSEVTNLLWRRWDRAVRWMVAEMAEELVAAL